MKFVSYRIKDDVVYYKIFISIENHEESLIEVRYKTLNGIHETLLKTMTNLPEFPAKKYFGNTNPSFLEKRIVELQAYLNGVIQYQSVKNLLGLKKKYY